MEKALALALFGSVCAVTVMLARKGAQKRRDAEQDGKMVRSATLGAPLPSTSAPLKEEFKGRVLQGHQITEIRLHDLVSLRTYFPSADCRTSDASERGMQYNQVLGEEDFILNDIVRGRKSRVSSEAFVRAGPRSVTHFNPRKVRAAIVTCGGLCPGLNNVIREITHALKHLYSAANVMGIVGGFNGFSGKPGYEPIELTLETVADCHHRGGTILASSRGGFDIDVIVAFLVEHQIDQLYVIGGDGTHRGAHKIAETCLERRLNVSVVGIPKTIDNDVDIIDRSFGFTTSVEAAQFAIASAKTEARCNKPNGIGIVKLMGRSAGFIAAHATLASGDVDLCLVPEERIELDGPKGCLPFLMNRVKKNGHAVIVVAEGAGEDLLGKSAEVDKGGNRKLPAIGEFLKASIVDFFKKHGQEATVKYIDPSYMIRSVPANASDSLYCMLLAQNAVHGAMAGYTSFSVGLVNNRVVFIPIPRLVSTSPRMMDPVGRTWERIISTTQQPQTGPSFDTLSVSTRSATL